MNHTFDGQRQDTTNTAVYENDVSFLQYVKEGTNDSRHPKFKAMD